jgi:hypothetical protein
MPDNDLPSQSGTFRVSDLVAVAAVATVLAVWTSVAAGHFRRRRGLAVRRFALCFTVIFCQDLGRRSNRRHNLGARRRV